MRTPICAFVHECDGVTSSNPLPASPGDAIQTLLSVHGAASFAEPGPPQKVWCDANTGGRRAGLDAAVGYEVLGKVLLDVPERISAMV